MSNKERFLDLSNEDLELSIAAYEPAANNPVIAKQVADMKEELREREKKFEVKPELLKG